MVKTIWVVKHGKEVVYAGEDIQNARLAFAVAAAIKKSKRTQVIIRQVDENDQYIKGMVVDDTRC